MTRAVRQIEITRAMKAAERAGLKDYRIEVDPASGKIIILTAKAIEDAEAVDASKVVEARLKMMGAQGG